MPGFHFEELKGHTGKCTLELCSLERIGWAPIHRLDPGLDVDRISGIVSVFFPHSLIHPVSKDKTSTESSSQKLTVPLSPLGSQGKGGKVGRKTCVYIQLGHRQDVAESQRCVSNLGLD